MTGWRYAIRLARADEVALLPAIEDAAAELFHGTAVAGDYLDVTQPIERLAEGQRNARLWVAIAPDGAVVGFAFARILAGEPHLEELDVHPEHGRRGVGAALVRTVAAWARAQGAQGLTLSTFRDVPWNAPFYAKLGFRALDTATLHPELCDLREHEVAHGLPIEHRVVMRLSLGPESSRATDRAHLRHEQYRDASNLDARIELHRRFRTNPQGWLRWLFEHLPRADRLAVLDVGCGPATLWRVNRARVPQDWRVQLCDLSTGMLRAAAGALPRDAQFHFATADAQALPFRDGTFDCVLANHMLYHVPDRPRALRAIARVLAPGGLLLASTIGERHLCEIDTLLRRAGAGEFSLGAFVSASFSLENGGAQIAALFDDVTLERYVDALLATEVEPVVAYVRSMGRVQADAIPAFTREVAQEIARSGAMRITSDSGVFLARRRG